MFENPMDVSVEKLILHYARRDKKDAKWPDVEFAMKGVPGTTCCVQMSRGFNGAGLTVPEKSWSRATGKFPGGKLRTFYSVDEIEIFLADKYGDSDNLRTGENGKQRGAGAIKSMLKGIPGVLVMRHAPIREYPPKNKFEHTEIWDGNGFVQQDMNVDALLGSPYVKFWPDKTTDESSSGAPAGVLDWAIGWWKVWDGNDYYYYFYGDSDVIYIGTPPNKNWKPPRTTGRKGRVEALEHGLKVTWPAFPGEEATEETFTRMEWTSTTDMFATSTKYSPLGAKKL